MLTAGAVRGFREPRPHPNTAARKTGPRLCAGSGETGWGFKEIAAVINPEMDWSAVFDRIGLPDPHGVRVGVHLVQPCIASAPDKARRLRLAEPALLPGSSLLGIDFLGPKAQSA